MWVDKSGRGHSVALADPGDMLDRALRNRIRAEGKAARRQILSALNGYLSEYFENAELLTPGKHEKRYKDAVPPPEYELMDDPSNPDISEVILQQIRDMPLRWRVDVAIAAVQYVSIPPRNLRR